MPDKRFDDSLIKLLKGEAAKEKWKGILRLKGFVLEKKVITKGKRKKRTKITLTVKTATKQYEIPVPERLKKKVESAISEGDKVKVIAGRKFGSIICYGIKKIDKEKQLQLTNEGWRNGKDSATKD